MTDNSQKNHSHKVKILLVDDKPENLTVLRSILKSQDFRLITARSGPDALQQLHDQEDIALILLDALIPGMDGFETAKLIRNLEKYNHIPIIFICPAHLHESDVLPGDEINLADYLFQPCNPSVLKSKVRIFLELHRHKEQLNKFLSVLEQTPDCVLITDKEGIIEYVNPGFERITGYMKDDVVGKTPRLLKSGKHPAVFYEELWSTILSGKSYQAKFINRKKNGELYYEETTIMPVKNLEGRITHFIGTGRDVTEKVRAKEEMETSRENFLGLIEKNVQGILIVDGSGVVRFINPAMESMLNRKAEELINQLFGIPLADGSLEINIIRKGGEIGSAEIKVDKTEWRGEECSLISIHDITERKKEEKELHELETELRQAHKMEAIGTMAAGFAHHLNNLLVPIMGYAEMEQRKLDPECNTYRNLGKVLKSAKRAKDLVSQILFFSRKTESKKVPVNLSTVLNEILPLLQSTLSSTVSIKFELAPNLPKILADAGQMHQILLNLCINAGHAMPEGGTITIGLEELGFRRLTTAYGEKTEDNFVCLSVRDSGCGMDPQTLERIYDPYFTTKADGEGTGIGLSVVQGIVDQHKGTIDVDSEPGKGTEFRICLPILHGGVDTFSENPCNRD